MPNKAWMIGIVLFFTVTVVAIGAGVNIGTINLNVVVENRMDEAK